MTTTTDVAVREPTGALAIQAGQVAWEPMQLAALAQLGIKDAPDGDKQVFLHVSQRTGLDPFARQIYMIGRRENNRVQRNGQWTDNWSVKWTIQTGIEGWRVIRDRAERRYGLRGILSRFTYYDANGGEHKVWVQKLPPVACEVTYTVVEPGGREVPYTSVLRFSEYVQMKDGTAIAQWAPSAKPVHMLEKCTEADAYRKAFPQDYSGVVLDDAMPPPEDAPPPQSRVTAEEIRARRPQPATAEVAREAPEGAAPASGESARPAQRASSGQVGIIISHLARLGVPEEDREARLRVAGRLARREVQLGSTKELTEDEARDVIRQLDKLREPVDLALLLDTGEVPSGGE